MAYTIYKSDGTAILVDDNAVDVAYYNTTGGGGYPGEGTTAGMGMGTQLIGRNAIDYGAPIAQNFLQMTENFASGTGYYPADNIALQGQLWFNKLSATNGNLFVRLTSATTGGTTNWSQVATLDNSGTFAGTAERANNLSNGTIGALPYQVSSNTTAFVAAGSVGQVLTQGSSSAPIWSSTPSIAGTNITGTASALTSGTAVNALAVSVTSTNANTNYPMALIQSQTSSEQGIYVDDGASITWNPSSNVLVIGSDLPATIRGGTNSPLNITATINGTSTGVVGGARGSILYQDTTGTSFLAAGTAAYVLTMSGSGLPTWAAGGGGGGGGAYLPGTGITFSGSGQTETINNSGVLSAVGGANISVNNIQGTGQTGNITIALTGTVPNANNATNATQSTNIVGGTAGAVVYQTSPSTTGMLSPGSAGQMLTIANGLPSWQTLAAGTASGASGNDFYTAGIGTGAENQIGVLCTGYSRAYMFNNTNQWGLYSDQGGVIIAYNRSSNSIQMYGNASTATTAANSNALGGQGVGYFQPALGFTPVQQGGGYAQLNDKIYIGWASPGTLNLQVDSTNFNNTWPINITGTSGATANSLGVNQSWGSPGRSFNSWYQNTTGKAISVQVSINCASDQTGANFLCGVNTGSYTVISNVTTKGADHFQIGGIVPPNWYYYAQQTGTTGSTLLSWAELT